MAYLDFCQGDAVLINAWYFILGMIAWQLIIMLGLEIHRAIAEYRQKRFINMVSIMFKDHSRITYISMHSSDKRALADLEKQIREEYDLPEASNDEVS